MSGKELLEMGSDANHAFPRQDRAPEALSPGFRQSVSPWESAVCGSALDEKARLREEDQKRSLLLSESDDWQ